RGYKTPEDAKAFLKSENDFFFDPFELDDVELAIDRLKRAVENKEKITVYGDYDVDGVTSVCTMCLYLRSKGAIVDYYIPNRSGEGYGVSRTAIEALAESGTTLIVTVDTGITANEEVEYAKTLGVDFVITDHHECHADLPKAVAVVNPHRPDSKYPFCELAGVGVVFKVISAYEISESYDGKGPAVARICNEYADLIAIGTIADVMPIKYENRLVVKGGLKIIENRPRVGLKALIDLLSERSDARARVYKKPARQTKITSGYIGYTIAPRLNAAGRIRSASLAVELFLTDDEEYASKIAKELCDANLERQNEENSIMKQAYEKIEAEHDFENDKVIVLDADQWHHGVIGIVASRITERYGLPSILLSFDGCDPENPTSEDIAKGSGRSIKGMNLVDALVHCDDCLVKYGGHELAAGLSVKRGELESFKRKINAYADKIFRENMAVPTLEADCEIEFSDLTIDVAEDIRNLEPFGVSNPVPVFVLRSATVLECTPVSTGKHTRFVLGNGENKTCSAICFSQSPSQLNLYVGDTVDLMFNLDINEWAGRKTVQLIIKDIRLSDGAKADVLGEKQRFEEIWGGASFSDGEDIIPTRDDFASVYNLVCASVRAGNDCISHRAMLSSLPTRVNYIKLKIIIRVLQEMNLLGIEEVSDEVYHFKVHFTKNKTDLEKSTLLRRLRTQQKQA
ncbi:MAG: single-stranded-DNA-specific exonuclease RecJ, partial [Clostridia bacterium]|nr:single-stranded-DNA-specific exonuclease RecJ [Clostridia bacterium]